MKQYAKTVVAAVGTVGTWLTSAAPDGVQLEELGGLLTAIATTVLVWAWPNEPKPTP